MNFEGFDSIELSPRDGRGFVYVLCWTDGTKETPFYVGQTQAIFGRMNDYHWADFQASTDFRVGEAVKHLCAKGFRVTAKYRVSGASRTEREKEERELIKSLDAEGIVLLNSLSGYNYRDSLPADQRTKIQNFIDGLLGLGAQI